MLYPERIRLLDELGFVWDFQTQKGQDTWMKWYRELEIYASEHGNPHVTRSYANTKLASWVWIQRQRRNGTYKSKGVADLMTPEQVSLLDKLGFRWVGRDETWWDVQFEQLNRFNEQHGHCEIEQVDGEESELSRWVSKQRHLNSTGKLQAERKAKLDTIGFTWNSETHDLKWRKMYKRLKQYHAAHGDSDAPVMWKENPKLAHWLSDQRQRRKKGQMPDEEMQLLDALGVTWKSRERGRRGSWEDSLAEVAAFKAKHGHCEIPLKYPENPKLGRFVNAMRTQRNNGTRSADRIAKLDALGFVWEASRTADVDGDGINATWKARFDELLSYEQEHGNCDVPTKWKANEELGHWVSQQRQLRKRGTLHPERQRRLDEIDFDWRSDDRKGDWRTRFVQLKAYKERFGNCRVPRRWKENPQLGSWATNQRQYRRKGMLSLKKEKLLVELGFEWVEG